MVITFWESNDKAMAHNWHRLNASIVVHCEPECPNTAIYEGGVEWTWGEEQSKLKLHWPDGTVVDGKENKRLVSDEFYYIVTGQVFTELQLDFMKNPHSVLQSACWLCVDGSQKHREVQKKMYLLGQKKGLMHGES